MSRPKSIFSAELASKAQADLDALDHHGVIQKLRAIVAASKHPVEMVAEILGVAAETIWRWAKAYKAEGLEGLYPKPRRAKPSKLGPTQKDQVLAWIDESKTPDGKDVHWTLERLRQAVIDHFGITLGINTLWVWLRKEDRKPKVPRPRHYKGDIEAQEAFKKTPDSTEQSA
jgi:transposase